MSEPTSPGNKYQITKNQHYHLKAIIKNFSDGRHVNVAFKNEGKILQRSPDSKCFCANRSWSQEAESKISWPIEAAFLSQVSRALNGQHIEDHNAISEYHLLWELRYNFSKNPSSDHTLYPGMQCGQLDRETEEYVESLGKVPVRPGGVIAGRFKTTNDINDLLIENKPSYDGIYWNVLRAGAGKFISADCYNGSLLVPISPAFLLFGSKTHSANIEVLNKESVISFNEKSISIANQLYFGRGLTTRSSGTSLAYAKSAP